ncbi:hypothetical protein SELMODRAFT_428054 [Selaginella moellendorffii]|uniref:Uncharacterized protein n=1 Tax=Selaginella moellendorffii TaxID=88036 RepID=D8T1J7_SELML|nr:hypothetical protein SELMODRAFT_428054 [Selaginella moellendorffii]
MRVRLHRNGARSEHGQENLEDAKLWSKLRLLEKVRILEMQMESKDPKAVQIELEDDPSQERIKFAAGFCEFSTRTYINKWIKDAWSPITTPAEAKRFVMERIGLASEEDWTGSCVCVPKTDRGNHWKHGGLIMFLPDERDRELAEGTLLKQARLYRLYLFFHHLDYRGQVMLK